ncbi:fructoselysine 6-kinase [Cereibacter sphaeroides]|uniref:Fructoselysine 6-kinase n=1 Tax=Cereibacter sphaeroides TaxID=1063 RepID=A0AAX1UKN4_CERSP|nr:fructoselysine 6-kinase [Cereibacter sphaeroides]RHZ94705.1 fructoselysine 6-kinase [Cereibacter sphaeroides]
MSRSPTLIAVGDNCLDVYLSKDRMAVGGNALNVAVQWMRAGLKTRYFGLVGPDPEGDVVRTALCRAGLDPDDCEVRPGSTAVTLLLERDGDRRFLLEDLGVGLGYVPEGAHYAALLAADWVHLGTHSAPELVRALVRDGARFSVDVSTHHDLLDLEGVPLVFASGPEDPSERVEPLLARFRERGAQATVVTCGSRGAFLEAGGTVTPVRARRVEVVDTCGAGDSFIARFIALWAIERRADAEALRGAADAATNTCLHEGGFPQPLLPIPSWLLDKYAEVIAAGEV